MMSSDRRQDPGKGLLLYLKEPSMKVIPADQPSKSGIVIYHYPVFNSFLAYDYSSSFCGQDRSRSDCTESAV